MRKNTLTRRQMCRLLAAGPATFALRARAEGVRTTAPFRLRYLLASSMYGTTKLEEILPEVQRSGADAIDIWPRRHADQREQIEAMGHERFAELLAKHDVKLGMLTHYDLGPFGLQDEMRVLKQFGGSMIISGSGGPKDLTGAELKSAVKGFIEKMKPHVALAEELGVTIGIENHAGALIASPDSLRIFADLAMSKHLGVALAPYHLPQEPGLLSALIRGLGPKLVHFYAWQHGKGCFQKLPKAEELKQMPGRGKLDFKPLLEALVGINYAGWTEIFMHPVPRGIPILDTTREVTEEINRARRYLEQALGQVT